jgi:integrase
MLDSERIDRPARIRPAGAKRSPANKGRRYPADPPRVEEIIAVMRQAGKGLHGGRSRALIVVLWRAGLRISEALALAESDLESSRGSLLVREGKGGKRRQVGMDEWGWEQLRPWLKSRIELPVGPLFCVISGETRGRPWSSSQARSTLRRLAVRAGVRRRFAPHQLRHAHAVEIGAGGGAVERHPAAAGSREPRGHVDLPAGHRQRRDHRNGSWAACPSNPGCGRACQLKVAKEGVVGIAPLCMESSIDRCCRREIRSLQGGSRPNGGFNDQ